MQLNKAILTFIIFTFFILYGSAQLINTCNQPCLSCQTGSSTICASCIFGYTLQGNYCVPNSCPVLYCLQCSGTICMQCQVNFMLINNTCICRSNFAPSLNGSQSASCVCPPPGSSFNPQLCFNCQIDGCLTCSNSTFCSSCALTYTSNGMGGCILCNISGCTSCIVNNFCQICSSNMTVTQSGQCAYCNITTPGCTACLKNNTCSCATGYYYITDSSNFGNQCQPCLVPYCNFCSQPNFCTNCSTGYIINSNGSNCSLPNTTVIPCNLPCLTCNVNGTCQSCFFLYSSTPNSLGQCYYCTVANCMTCLSNNTAICTTCFSGYTTNNNGTFCIMSNIPNCQTPGANGTCTVCSSYFTSVDGQCYPCSSTGPQCATCLSTNPSICTGCTYGNYLSNGVCLSCPIYCSSCTSPNSCTNYLSNIILIGGQLYVQNCLFPCTSCSNINPAYCTQCSNGYYLLNGLCYPCTISSNCQTCTAAQPSQCLNCYTYMFLAIVNGTAICQQCVYPCTTCQSYNLSSCTSCPVNYNLVNSVCLSNTCSPFCEVCSSATTCQLCMPGYFIYNGTGNCMPGVAGCIVSLVTNPSYCQSCYIGMGTNHYTNLCFQCPNNCLFCSTPGTCQQCNDGYYVTVNSNIVCAPNCASPCATCSYTNPKQCTACIAGYVFNQSYPQNCQPLSSCSFGCSVCPLGYSLTSTQNCIACNQNCAACLANNANYCTSCYQGQWLNNNGLCLACQSGCLNCISSTQCLQCQNGLVSNSWNPLLGSTPINSCIPCQAPCLSCILSPNYCLSCINGYTIFGNQCVNNYNYLFTVLVNANSTVFYQNYPQFVNSIVGCFSQPNYGIFFPTGVTPNPSLFVFSAEVSSQCNPQTPCATLQYNNLQTLFNSGTVGGMTIISYTLNSSNGNPSPPCVSPCSTCTSPGGSYCLSCIYGYVLRNGSCVSATCSILYCQYCTNSFTCVQCLPTFILANNACICQSNFSPSPVNSQNASCICPAKSNNCVVCKVSNCLSCTVSNYCTTCVTGYSLISGGGCRSCLIPSCISCIVNNFCSVCAVNFTISTTGTCVFCNSIGSGCSICSDNNICSQCNTGYQLMGTSCIQCTIPNCINCNSTNTCSNCQNGFVLNLNNTCSPILCSFPCIQCYTNGSCLTCISPQFSKLSNNGQCYTCQVANCFICNYPNTNNCTQCMNNYNLATATNGTTTCTLQSTIGCNALINNGLCISCKSGYAFSNPGYCLVCTTTEQACTSCLATNTSICTACQAGFYISNNNCFMCPSYCQYCNATACLQYNGGAVMINNQIYIEACLWPCITCANSNYNFCIQCSPGFNLQNGICISCTPSSNCYSCNPSTPNNCLTCFNFAYIATVNQNQVCVYCSYPCMTCLGPSAANCTSCVNNYFIVNGICTLGNCGQYCGSCVSTGCAVCMPGFFLFQGNGTCLPGAPGCLFSLINNPSYCQQCASGMALNPFSNTCIQCPQNCASCTYTSICTACFTGYYLTGDSPIVCAPICQYPCATCSYTNPNFCFSCNAGYIFNTIYQNQCQPLNDCSPSCVICPQSFTLISNQSCVACATSCFSCNSSAPQVCTSCSSGQYLNNGQCLNCSVGCQSCISSNTCQTCQFGYANQMLSTNFISQAQICVPCQSPCLDCYLVPTYCVGCINGYTLVGTQCMSLFNYKINITVMANFSQFYLNYPTFTAQLITPFNTSSNIGLGLLFPNGVNTFGTSNKITYGAYISSICMPSTICSQTQYNNLLGLLNSSTIGNMAILTSSVTINGGSPYPPNNTNFICSNPCLSCNLTQSICLTCISGYKIIGAYCVSSSCQILYCKTCSNNNTCTQCNPSFILTNNTCICQTGWQPLNLGNPNTTCFCNSSTTNQQSLCTSCQATNCLSCSTPSNCSSCASPYSITSQNVCILCNINNCISCQSNNFCSSCGGGLSVSSSGDRCILCNAQFCQSCSSPNVCSACQTGYYFDSQNVSCITCNLFNCLQCQGNNICSQCAPGYTITSNFSCQLSTCNYPCLSCNSNNSCLTCVSPPFVSTPGPSGCFSCNVANCITCNVNSTSICTTCIAGYTVNSNSTLCLPNCQQTACSSCSSTNASFCLTCTSSFVSVSGTCQPCSNGCLNCLSSNVSSCSSCLTGFYLVNSSCFVCPSYCSDCDSANICNQLASSSGQSLVDVNGVTYLANCDQGCKDCSQNSPTTCLNCLDGYYLQQSLCYPCTLSSNCKTCLSTNSSQCTNCYPNYYLTVSNGINICSSCISPCLTCLSNSLGSCLSCPTGYLLSGNSCLSNQCPLYCMTCSSNVTCVQCITGYIAYSGNCLPCLQGCAKCSSSAPGICLQCSAGTYLVSSTQQCSACSPNCLACQPNGCTTCMNGYYLSAILTCALNCIFPCSTCSTANPSVCLSCLLGYTFNPSSIQNCQPNTGCSATFSCVSCPLGFVLSNMQCISCVSNCARCLPNMNSTCTSCYSGQYLMSNNTCANCPSYCQTCQSKTVCLNCRQGYTDITSAAPNNPVTCVQCSQPCLNCQNSPSNCLSCILGYSLNEGICISNFNFGFTVKLSVTPAVFYQNYLSFLTSLANNVDINYGAVAVGSIVSGSVTVVGSINTNSQPETSTSQTQYQNIQNSLTVNSNIAGMTVLSSQVNSNGGSAQVPDNSGGLSQGGIIAIAVIIPIVVLAAAIFGIYMYCQKKRENMGLQMQLNSSDTPKIEIKLNDEKL